MSIKVDCDVILDLMPLYEDKCCSEKTRELVDAHLKECKSCQMINNYYHEDVSINVPVKDPDTEIIKSGMKKIRRKQAFLCAVLVAIVLFFVFLYHALTPFPVGLSHENCQIDVISVGNPEEDEFIGGLAQTILLDITYSSKINKFDSVAPGIGLLWEEVQIKNGSETENVALISVSSHGLENVWAAMHSDLSDGTRTHRTDISVYNQDMQDTVTAIYYVEDLNRELHKLYKNTKGEQQDVSADTWTKLVEECGQLVWSAEDD